MLWYVTVIICKMTLQGTVNVNYLTLGTLFDVTFSRFFALFVCEVLVRWSTRFFHLNSACFAWYSLPLLLGAILGHQGIVLGSPSLVVVSLHRVLPICAHRGRSFALSVRSCSGGYSCVLQTFPLRFWTFHLRIQRSCMSFHCTRSCSVLHVLCNRPPFLGCTVYGSIFHTLSP